MSSAYYTDSQLLLPPSMYYVISTAAARTYIYFGVGHSLLNLVYPIVQLLINAIVLEYLYLFWCSSLTCTLHILTEYY
jgi:hypothetical protein